LYVVNKKLVFRHVKKSVKINQLVKSMALPE